MSGTWAQPCDSFARRHVGPSPEETVAMLQTIGVKVGGENRNRQLLC